MILLSDKIDPGDFVIVNLRPKIPRGSFMPISNKIDRMGNDIQMLKSILLRHLNETT